MSTKALYVSRWAAIHRDKLTLNFPVGYVNVIKLAAETRGKRVGEYLLDLVLDDIWSRDPPEMVEKYKEQYLSAVQSRRTKFQEEFIDENTALYKSLLNIQGGIEN